MNQIPPPPSNTANPKPNLYQDEIKNFARHADQWWNENGPFAPLHRLNPLRLSYIHEQAGKNGNDGVAGLHVLDIGCGGGLLCEPLARAGAIVTGIDASSEAVAVARHHAKSQKIDINYQQTRIENFPEKDFDLVLAMEVIEHIPQPIDFILAAAAKLKPGGKIILSTINRTPLAFLTAIIAAEYILNWLPIGTHHYNQLIPPKIIRDAFRKANIQLTNQTGVSYDPILKKFFLSSSLHVNYMMTGQRPAT